MYEVQITENFRTDVSVRKGKGEGSIFKIPTMRAVKQNTT
jgi:hypothetical protein